jgi:hypothetical protein
MLYNAQINVWRDLLKTEQKTTVMTKNFSEQYVKGFLAGMNKSEELLNSVEENKKYAKYAKPEVTYVG